MSSVNNEQNGQLSQSEGRPVLDFSVEVLPRPVQVAPILPETRNERMNRIARTIGSSSLAVAGGLAIFGMKATASPAIIGTASAFLGIAALCFILNRFPLPRLTEEPVAEAH